GQRAPVPKRGRTVYPAAFALNFGEEAAGNVGASGGCWPIFWEWHRLALGGVERLERSREATVGKGP
ncbi:MAG: hypothetical protein ACM3ZE_28240, partial [Myxococcales bacterium]